jgi:hypothetical protein
MRPVRAHLSIPPMHLQTCTVAAKLQIWPWAQFASEMQAPDGPSSARNMQKCGRLQQIDSKITQQQYKVLQLLFTKLVAKLRHRAVAVHQHQGQDITAVLANAMWRCIYEQWPFQRLLSYPATIGTK